MKVLLIGDSCEDRYFYGDVKRLNPEAPVPILEYRRGCLLYTSPSPRDVEESRMPSSA